MRLRIKNAVEELLAQTEGPEDAMLYVNDLAVEIVAELDLTSERFDDVREEIKRAIIGE